MEYGKSFITYPLPAYEPPKCEGVCRGIDYIAHEMCTMWLSGAVGSQSQAPRCLSLLCLDTDSLSDMAYQFLLSRSLAYPTPESLCSTQDFNLMQSFNLFWFNLDHFPTLAALATMVFTDNKH